jgi:hypothetical protein
VQNEHEGIRIYIHTHIYIYISIQSNVWTESLLHCLTPPLFCGVMTKERQSLCLPSFRPPLPDEAQLRLHQSRRLTIRDGAFGEIDIFENGFGGTGSGSGSGSGSEVKVQVRGQG